MLRREKSSAFHNHGWWTRQKERLVETTEELKRGKKALSFLNLADSCSEYSGKIFSFIIWPLFIIIVLEVIARRGFGSPTSWVMVLSRFIFGGYFLIGGAYCLLKNAHPAMPLIRDRLKPRNKAILDLFTSALFFLFCAVFLWETVGICWESTLMDERAFEAWRAPRWPYMWLVPFATVLLIFQGIAQFIRTLRHFAEGDHK